MSIWVQKKFFFKRVLTNIQFFGQESTFHQDSDKNEEVVIDWSFLIFVDSDWNSEHGGDFICIENGKYKNIPFIPNNGQQPFLLHYSIETLANTLCLYKPRKTIQFLFEEID